jgi:colanic acid biosynthesis glycosyl transferase WcaI
VKTVSILFVTQHYPPETAATGQLLAELAEDLVQQGLQVTILAGRPSYGLTTGSTETPSRETRNGVLVIRAPSTRFRRTSHLGRIANWLSFPVAGLLRGISGMPRPDVVVGYSAPPTALPTAYILAKRWRAQFVVYVQDVYPHVAHAVNMMSKGILFKLWRMGNRWLYRRASSIITLGEHMATRLQNEGVSAARISTVHNWADGQILHPMSATRIDELKESSGLTGRFVVLYSGNLGMAHDFAPIRDALEILKMRRERLALLFIGEGVHRSKMEDFVTRNAMGDFVHFNDYVPYQNLASSLNVGDAFLLSMLEGTEGLVVPSKLYSYLAVGRPILAICTGASEITDIVNTSRCGFTVRTAKELSDAICQLMDNLQLRADMGQNARSTFEKKFDRRHATERIAKILTNTVR